MQELSTQNAVGKEHTYIRPLISKIWWIRCSFMHSKHCAGHGLAKPEDEAADRNGRDRSQRSDYVEKVGGRDIFIVACHRNITLTPSAPRPHAWLRKARSTVSGAGWSEGTAPSNSGMANVFRQTVHS
jgi:hypothetical protein